MTRARRASRPRFRLLPTVLLTLAILGLPTVVYAWGRSSSSFDITTVRVAGAHLVPEKRALRLLRQDYTGSNLFTVTGGDVRKTLAPLCLVAGATIDRDFPETLAVTITEYEPAAYALAGDRWYVLDRRRLRDLHGRGGGRPAGRQGSRLRRRRPKPSPSAGAATDGRHVRRSARRGRRLRRRASRRRPGAGGSPAAAHRRLRPRATGERRDRRGGRRDARRDRRPAAVAAAPVGRGAERRRPAHPPVRRRSGDHVGRLRAHARQDGRPPHGAQEVRGRRARPAPSWTSRSPTGPWPNRCSSRRSSDGRGSLQPVVEPRSSDGPPAGLFDTPKGRGYGRSKVGSPGRPDRVSHLRTAARAVVFPERMQTKRATLKRGLRVRQGSRRRVSTTTGGSAR